MLGICEEATNNSGQCPAKRVFAYPDPSEVPDEFAEKLAAALGPGMEKATQYADQLQ